MCGSETPCCCEEEIDLGGVGWQMGIVEEQGLESELLLAAAEDCLR